MLCLHRGRGWQTFKVQVGLSPLQIAITIFVPKHTASASPLFFLSSSYSSIPFFQHCGSFQLEHSPFTMPSPSQLVIPSLLFLFSAAHALPAININGGSLYSRTTIECPVGSQWYTCAQTNFASCCTVDACHNHGVCPDSHLPTYTPPNSSPVDEPACTAGMTNQRYDPRVNGVSREMGDTAYPIDNIVNNWSTKDVVVGQVITFSDIPANAQNCSLGWVAHDGSTFVAEGEGSVSVFELNSLPTVLPTWNTLHAPGKNVIGKQVGSPAFAGWTVGDSEHSVGSVNCMPDMAFFTRIPEGKEGHVEIQHSGGSGWFLEFDC